ncbi:MAG: RNA methyltransferase [Bacteroidota bacterium]
MKKNRDKDHVFVLEGSKNLLELLDSDFEVIKLLCTKIFYIENEAKLSKLSGVVSVTEQQIIESAGSFKTNNAGLAIVQMPDAAVPPNLDGWILALDRVQDPGNLGTIIRTADWFGIRDVICSPDTVDVYNPKVINATMGSFSRVKVSYGALGPILEKQDLPVFGALLEGEVLHQVGRSQKGIILMGNESKGISDTLKTHITTPVSIPRIGGAESLNVAIATGILCAHFCL